MCKIDIKNLDCFEFLKQIEDNGIDLILVDPPYEISRSTGFSSVVNGVERFALSMDFGEWDYDFAGLDIVIKEFYRVLAQDGIVLVLEFVKADKPNRLRKCVDFYSNKFLPKIGGMISKNKEAYEYLPNSIENFYTPSQLVSLFEEQGFKTLKSDSYNFGQVGVFIFKK